jgi:hypothetical protein
MHALPPYNGDKRRAFHFFYGIGRTPSLSVLSTEATGRQSRSNCSAVRAFEAGSAGAVHGSWPEARCGTAVDGYFACTSFTVPSLDSRHLTHM